MGTPTRHSRLREKVDSEAMVNSKKASSSPILKQLNLCNSPSTLRKRGDHCENIANAKLKSPSSKGEGASDGSSVSSSCKSLLLEPRVGRTPRSHNLIPCMDSLPAIEERSRLPRKSPRTSITKPKLSPRKNRTSPLRPPPPRHLQTTTNGDAYHSHGQVMDEKTLRKSPKWTSITKPTLSPKKGPISSPLLPPRTLRAITDASYFNDFSALTPIILYGEEKGQGEHTHRHPHPPQSAPGSNQYYHQSPHWSGQVRVNPFSPVPEQYLRPAPPTSVKSVTRESRKRQHHTSFYGGLTNIHNNNDNGNVETSMEMMAPPQAKKTRFQNPILPRRMEVLPDITTILPLFDIDTSQHELDFIDREISPTDVMTQSDILNTGYDDGGSKPPPRSMDIDAWENGKSNGNSNSNINNNRMQIKRGRYLDDFQEVKFLGAGSFGSVYACLSRLDGCMYAVKAISPTGRSSSCKKGNGITGYGPDAPLMTYGSNEQYLYGKCPSSMSSAHRRDLPPSPQRRKKTLSRLGIGLDNSIDDDDCYIEGIKGCRHWNDGALRRVLREVFALAALCQQDDFRTFHIVRYHQAWLEEDGTLYIQTELCTATLRDEMSGSVEITDDVLQMTGNVTSGGQRINVFRQLKILREVLLALELVHQQGMVHLDIKPENIFVKNNLYKLGDFGLANAFTTNGENTLVVDLEEGDSRYMSKDLLDSNPKDLTKCDIFSLGATIYEICSRQPLPSCGQDWQDLRNGKVPLLPGTMPSLNAIIKDMMHPDPDKRPSATDILSRDTLRQIHDANPLLRQSSSYKVDPQMQSARPLTRSASWTM